MSKVTSGMAIIGEDRQDHMVQAPDITHTRYLIVLLFISVALNGCATITSQNGPTEEQVLLESKGRLSCYEKESAELDQARKDGHISDEDYKRKKKALDKLTVKELRLELKITDHAPSYEIYQSADELDDAIETAKKVGLTCVTFINEMILKALPGVHGGVK